ncbi:hypothetical protein [Saccharomonospora sp. CUA-673]|uniref:hypothetical protein n=1 Tax=Saccharomonospora sp. CUA-673 TaxID=1904969 RepID=UPI0011150BC4|nr:hypothetical protein [Saccharomonospora sp. CUA-673]
MKKLLISKHGRGRWILLPVALLGLLLIQIVLLPAHGMATHDTLLGASGHSSVAAPSTHTATAGHDEQGAANHSHSPDGGVPDCHAAPHIADIASIRVPGDDSVFGPGAFLVLMAGVLTVSLLLRRPPTAYRRWSSRPPWRPAGSDLLTCVCIART